MSKDHNTVTCPHKLGFNCLTCYPVQYFKGFQRHPGQPEPKYNWPTSKDKTFKG